jgi:hypothetical protein
VKNTSVTGAEPQAAPVTGFFIPGVGRDRTKVEDAYERIRDAAEADTGHRPTQRRIFKIDCRRKGQDYEAKVGKRDQLDGRMVVAILELGRDVYTIRCTRSAGARQPEPIVVGKGQVYSVTDFGN